MPSGPQTFLGSRFFKALATSETDSWMEVSVTPIVKERGTGGGAGSTGLNTKWKKLFKILAFLLLSVINDWPSRRKLGDTFSFVADFTKDQKRFGVSERESLSLWA